MKKIVCFGEVLWDMLPDGKVAGGAPMNVAFRLQSLGMDTEIISKTGQDSLGQELRTIIQSNQVPLDLVQEDKQLATSVVQVSLNEKGSPTYDIVYPSAWDRIEATARSMEAVEQADALIFGSLACRDVVSKASLYQLIEKAPYKIFDVNLRAPYYQFDLIADLMHRSDFIKLNDEELVIIATALGAWTTDFDTQIEYLAAHSQTTHICVTKGGEGAVLYIEGEFYRHPGFQVQVRDTIGAGDSFLAGLIYQLFRAAPPDEALEFACAIGALVAAAKGANPVICKDQMRALIQQV